MEPAEIIPTNSNWFGVAIAVVTSLGAFLAAWVTTRRAIGKERIEQLEARLAEGDRPLAPEDRERILSISTRLDRLYEAFIEFRAEVHAFIAGRPRR